MKISFKGESKFNIGDKIYVPDITAYGTYLSSTAVVVKVCVIIHHKSSPTISYVLSHPPVDFLRPEKDLFKTQKGCNSFCQRANKKLKKGDKE